MAIYPVKTPQAVHAHGRIAGNDIPPLVIHRAAGDEEHVIAHFTQPKQIPVMEHVGDGLRQHGGLIRFTDIVQKEAAVVPG